MTKASIRKQIDQAKEKLDKAFAEEDVPPGVKAAVESLLIVMNIIVTVLLEKNVRKNSSNSGLPPSRNNGSNGNRNKPDHGRRKNGDQLENTRKVTTSSVVSASKCSKCGSSLAKAKVVSVQERTKIDIVYEITEHTVQSEAKECPSCGHENKGKFPDGMDGKVQYGIGIKASILNFLMIQMISLERVQEHLRGLIGRCISQAVMLKYVSQLSESLEGWEQREIVRILGSPVIYCDETSLRVDKKNYWVHSYSYGETTLKFLHPKRGREAIEDIGIIPKYSGTLVHDSWTSYLSYDHVDHGLCGSHLLRELKFVEDSVGHKWATKMKKILQDTAGTVANRPEKSVLTSREFKRLQSRYRNALTRAKQELPDFPQPTGKRGRPKHTDAQNLLLRLSEYEQSVLLFARVKEVDFTNNRAERDLRDSKLKQKVSGTFRKEEYARHYVRISSYVKSMRYKGYSSLEAIMLALQGNIPEGV